MNENYLIEEEYDTAKNNIEQLINVLFDTDEDKIKANEFFHKLWKDYITDCTPNMSIEDINNKYEDLAKQSVGDDNKYPEINDNYNIVIADAIQELLKNIAIIIEKRDNMKNMECHKLEDSFINYNTSDDDIFDIIETVKRELKKDVNYFKQQHKELNGLFKAIFSYLQINNQKKTVTCENLKDKIVGSEEGFILSNNFIKIGKKDTLAFANKCMVNKENSLTISEERKCIKNINSLLSGITPKTNIETVGDYNFIETEKVAEKCEDLDRMFKGTKLSSQGNFERKFMETKEKEFILSKSLVDIQVNAFLFDLKDCRRGNIVVDQDTGRAYLVDYLIPTCNLKAEVYKESIKFENDEKCNENNFALDFFSTAINQQIINVNVGASAKTDGSLEMFREFIGEGYIDKSMVLESFERARTNIINQNESLIGLSDDNSIQKRKLCILAADRFNQYSQQLSIIYNINDLGQCEFNQNITTRPENNIDTPPRSNQNILPIELNYTEKATIKQQKQHIVENSQMSAQVVSNDH